AENILTCLVAAEFCEEPARVLQPPSPENVTAVADQNGHPVIRWDIIDDDFNSPVGFNVMAQQPGEPFIDDAPEDQDRWDLLNMSMTRADQHSGTHSYRVNTSEALATMTLREEIVIPDTIWAWMNYNLRTFLDHYIALEISYDGYDWEALPGIDTEDIVMNENNLGPGITGDTNDQWEHTYFLSGDHSGEIAKLRFRYYQFARRFQNERCYIDDIGPFAGVEWSEIVAEGIEAPIWIDEEHDMEDGLEYSVQAVDAEGDLSFWTVPTGVEPHPDGFELTAPTGWMLVSAPIIPDPPDLEDVFAEWVERELLIIVKNGAGQVFVPSQNFNNIGQWNPLEGYWIKIVSTDTLLIQGEFISSNTPIPLTEGWNSIAYLPMEPSPAPEAWEVITDNLIFAKDGHGHFWTLEHDFSNMDDLTAGRGYMLKMSDMDTLIYPMIARINLPIAMQDGDVLSHHNVQVGRGGIYDAREQLSGAFTGSINRTPTGQEYRTDQLLTRGGNDFMPISHCNHSLLLQWENLPAGEIVLLDGDGFESGRVVIEGGQTRIGVAAWGEPEQGAAGFSANEPLRAEWRGLDSDERVPLNLVALAGDDTYRTDGFSVMDVIVTDGEKLPVDFGIMNAYPNPFNSRTTIAYQLPEHTSVSIQVFDVSGRVIATLVDGMVEAGRHSVSWNGANVPTGIYFCNMTSSAYTETIKLLLVK
ncbi:MAG: T9SS type A sorting domain-containing protein, partial [Candidatus Electryoneaceae bacterium]|nr:T9SS type A sorting domain-containing protein [Candidatus Electryoneaceae bacterium]